MQEYLEKLDKTLDEYLVKKAPTLPKDIVKLLVTLSPWFAILGVILGIPTFMAIFGLSAMFSPFAMMAGFSSLSFWIFWIIGAIQLLLAGMSIKPLFAKQKKGWELLFYSQLLSFITSLGHYNVGSFIGTLIAVYFLYQIKQSYK